MRKVCIDSAREGGNGYVYVLKSEREIGTQNGDQRVLAVQRSTLRMKLRRDEEIFYE